MLESLSTTDRSAPLVPPLALGRIRGLFVAHDWFGPIACSCTRGLIGAVVDDVDPLYHRGIQIFTATTTTGVTSLNQREAGYKYECF